jgi:hypothetical protein
VTLWIHVNGHVMCYFWDFGPLGDECLQVGSPSRHVQVEFSAAGCPYPGAGHSLEPGRRGPDRLAFRPLERNSAFADLLSVRALPPVALPAAPTAQPQPHGVGSQPQQWWPRHHHTVAHHGVGTRG